MREFALIRRINERNLRYDKSAIKKREFEKSVSADEKSAETEIASEHNPFGRRESMFAPREVENQVMLEDAAIEEGIDVLKKRRGTIFGNDSGTMFGN